MNTAGKLALVLGPVTESEFFKNYWEQHPMHVSRSSSKHFEGLLSIQTIESILSTQALSFPTVQLTQLGQPIDVSEYTDESRRILAHRLIEKNSQGATIVFSKAHEYITSLADFRRDIQKELQLQCQTNVYLSAKGRQGFNAHFDSHDVFILQVAGSKTFNFYEGGVDLPFQHDGFQKEEHEAGALTQSISLEPGDTLYIPRGVMHDAVATEQTSLHITLGVYAITLRDVLIEMIQDITSDELRYRKSVPRKIRSQLNAYNQEEAKALLQSLTPALTHEGLKNALYGIEDANAINSAPNVMGMLDRQQSNLTDNTVVQFNFSQLISVERSNEHIRLKTHGQVLEFTHSMRGAIEQLLSTEKMPMKDLTGLESEQKNALYTRLRYANLLIIDKQ